MNLPAFAFSLNLPKSLWYLRSFFPLKEDRRLVLPECSDLHELHQPIFRVLEPLFTLLKKEICYFLGWLSSH